MPSQPSRTLETFLNPNPQNDYLIHMEMPEFTCLCPKTGQPDFAHLLLDYIPDQNNIELKSLKMYLWSFRNEGAFHEAVTNLILKDIIQTCQPRFARLLSRWYVRGGIYTQVLVEHRQPQWQPTITIPPVHFSTNTPTQP